MSWVFGIETIDEKYEIYSFEYTTGSIYSGYACNRIEATFPVELQGTQNIPIHVHSAYTWWDGSVTTKFVGHEETITFKPTPLEEPAKGYPHLEAGYTVNPESISSIDEAVVVALKIKGIGGKVEDLPPDILEKLPRKPLDVVLVIDKSGSMDSTDYPPDRITAAKEAAKIFVNQLKEDDRVAVVSFSSSTSTVVSFTSDKSSARGKIDRISTGGGTAIGEGTITALSVLEKSREDTVKTIILLSDGAHNEGISPNTAANRAKGRGIPIYTVGIGTVGGGIDSLDESTLKEIASITGGEYLYAPGASELKKIYEKMSTKVLNVAGLDVRVDAMPTKFFNVLKQEPSSLEFGTIPVDTEKAIEITGKLTINALNEKLPIIQRFKITYTDLITGERTIIKEPIYVEVTGKVEPSDVEIKDISFKRNDNSYEDANVYHLSDDIKVEVEIKNPDDVTVKSIAALDEKVTGKSSTDSKEMDKDSIVHSLDNGGVIGQYTFRDWLFYPRNTLTDSEDDTVYVVFDGSKKYKSFSNSDKYHGDLTPAIILKRHRFTSQITLHPRSKRILKEASLIVGGSTEKNEAAKKLALNVNYNLLKYNAANCDFNDDYAILDNRCGDCTDFTALYISLARAINIPARGIRLGYISYEKNETTGKVTTKHSGHAFDEVHVNDRWIHVEPQGDYNSPDRYLMKYDNIACSVESEPGKDKADKLTTIKYAVGMIYPNPYAFHPQITINLNEETTTKPYLFFENRAKSTDAWWNPLDSEKYIAEDFDIEIIDSGRLEVKVKNLRRDDTLDINELDYCTLTIKVPDEYAKTIDKGSSVTILIKLKVDYETIDGEELEKDYIIKVRVER